MSILNLLTVLAFEGLIVVFLELDEVVTNIYFELMIGLGWLIINVVAEKLVDSSVTCLRILQVLQVKSGSTLSLGAQGHRPDSLDGVNLVVQIEFGLIFVGVGG